VISALSLVIGMIQFRTIAFKYGDLLSQKSPEIITRSVTRCDSTVVCNAIKLQLLTSKDAEFVFGTAIKKDCKLVQDMLIHTPGIPMFKFYLTEMKGIFNERFDLILRSKHIQVLPSSWMLIVLHASEDVLKELLTTDKLSGRDTKGCDLTERLIQHGYSVCIKEMISYGMIFDPRRITMENLTMYAEKGNLPMLEYIMTDNYRFPYDWKVSEEEQEVELIYCAIQSGSIDVARFLIKRSRTPRNVLCDAILKYTEERYGEDPFMWRVADFIKSV
jgi:hypothetical protein